MQTRKPMVLVIAGPNGSGKSTVTQIRKHKEDISIFPNEYWDEEKIMKLM